MASVSLNEKLPTDTHWPHHAQVNPQEAANRRASALYQGAAETHLAHTPGDNHGAYTPPTQSMSGPEPVTGFNPFKPASAPPNTTAQNQESTETNPFKLGPGPPTPCPRPTAAPQPQPYPSRAPIPNQNLTSPGRFAKICVRTPVTFPITWYTHPTAPHFHICSRCYLDYIWGTIFRDDFHPIVYDDAQPRACKFNNPWFKDVFDTALVRKELEWFIMSIRVKIPACKGVAGVKGTEHTQWFVASDNAVPTMVICEECHENYVLSRGLSAHIARSRDQQDDDAVWSCDFAVPYIKEEYLKKGETGDWLGFCKEANERMQIQPCPGTDAIHPRSRNWFTPIRGMDGMLVCHACYCDYILNSGKADNWCHAENVTRYTQHPVFCMLGQTNLFEAMDVAQHMGDMGIFWRAAEQVNREAICHSNGMNNATWFTLASDPKDFAICGGCFFGMIAPWSATHLFKPKPDTDKNTTLLCSFNPHAPRYEKYMSKAAEAFYTQDLDVLENYIKTHSGLPVCRKDTDFKDRNWFGWEECTICPECYHDVVRGTAFADRMPLHDAPISASRACELYSPKMRALYAEACQTGNPTTLLATSLERRAIHSQTVPLLRRIFIQAGFELVRQLTLSTTPGDQLEVRGPLFAGQAEGVDVVLQAGGQWETVKALEARWRAVE